MNLREGVLKGDEDLARLADAFRTVHDKMYGYTPDLPAQALTFRVSAVARFQKAALGSQIFPHWSPRRSHFFSGSRRVFFLQASGFADTPVYQRVDLPLEFRSMGPQSWSRWTPPRSSRPAKWPLAASAATWFFASKRAQETL